MNRCISSENFIETGLYYAHTLIKGRYKMPVLYALMEFKTVRYNELKRYIKNISYKSLTLTLRELEADGLINRKDFKQNPPKVEYSLTEIGKTLIPILDSLCEWGDLHK